LAPRLLTFFVAAFLNTGQQSLSCLQKFSALLRQLGVA
jgi:hypothetical protein